MTETEIDADAVVVDVYLENRRTNPNFKPAVSLSVVRKHYPRAFRHLCNTDTACASIAVSHGWISGLDDDPKRGWDNRAAVSRTLARIDAMPKDSLSTSMRAALRSALEHYAPENLDLLEPQPARQEQLAHDPA